MERASPLLKMLNLNIINVAPPFLTASWGNGSCFVLCEKASMGLCSIAGLILKERLQHLIS